MRVLLPATWVLALGLGCASLPHTDYSFDTNPGGWILAGHDAESGVQSERYTHEVHGERLDVWEFHRPAPGSTSSEFATLAPAARALPALGVPTATARSLGDDDINGTPGYWVSQYGREHGETVQAAAFVVPSGRRYFVVRMASHEDDVEQLRAWLRDILLRNFRLPPPLR